MGPRTFAPLVLVLACACGASKSGTPTSPTAPGSPGTPAAPAFNTTGRIVDILTGDGIAAVTASGTGLTGVASDGTGAFSIGGDSSISAAQLVSFAGAAVVTRQTYVKVPGAAVTVPLIPASFDLASFNEMFRNPSTGSTLNRWIAAPPIVIRTQTMQFTNLNDTSFTTVSDAMTTAEHDGLLADLTWALPQFTNNQFTAFASATRTDGAAGQTVQLLNSGVITVGRLVGLTTATNYWGYTRWQFRSDGAVTAGMIMLDRDFERRSPNLYLRSLRSHELGHALGYGHVTGRNSVMNSAALYEPTPYDLQAARIAFQRPTGNRAPDTDPSTYSTNSLKVLRWTDPIR